MSEIKIRNVSPATVAALDTQAKAKGMSRSAYLRILLELAANKLDIELIEEKYAALATIFCEGMGQVVNRLSALELAIKSQGEQK